MCKNWVKKGQEDGSRGKGEGNGLDAGFGHVWQLQGTPEEVGVG